MEAQEQCTTLEAQEQCATAQDECTGINEQDKCPQQITNINMAMKRQNDSRHGNPSNAHWWL